MGDSYDLKPIPDAPSPPSFQGKRNRMSEDVLHELVPSDLGKMRDWFHSRGADTADFSDFPGNRPQQRKGFLEKLKSFLSKRQQYVIAKKLRRSRRQKRADEMYAMEVVVVVDPSLWEKYYSGTSATDGLSKEEATELTLRQHFAHVVNGISLRFESIEDADMDIYVTLSGFIFYKTVDSTNPLPPEIEIPSVNGVNYADVDIYLNKTVTWAEDVENLPHNDHIAVFTGYDLYSVDTSNDGVSGMAWVGGLCSDFRTSVNEDGSYFVTVSVAAHEIGHNMNATHDGTGWADDCDDDDKYIMAPMVTDFSPDDDYTVNPWRFSQCSIDAFKDYVNKMGDGNCLLDQGDYYNTTEYNSHVSLMPGELYTPDEQCKLVRGETATLRSDAESEDICTLMECIDGDGYYSYYAAARGTPCGTTSDNKWCIDGQCVTKSDSHTGGNTDDGSIDTGGDQDETETENTDENTDGSEVDETVTENTDENGDGTEGCVDVGYEGYSCQWVADYFLESEYKATPSEWCTDPTWGEDNCCAFCSDYGSSNTGGTQESENTAGSDTCVDVGYAGYSCQWIADYFLASEYKATPSEWCRDPTWGEDNCCAFCAVYGK
ncbi:A disintegrin and metalloproteinase with thrombospondin motifs 16-like [Mercenaria mercenaria]|uniref:A disintegrin and metalloproteinase with thrombospondin motifs 16-like n=1 Tax=Mercenaria mercenaria TaxID=6596 RepID=UPI00234ED57D|nr:A disintegrin and metalloproteinase with thrombospondin motifs 16-like [Mercenaria mercenaria]